MMRKDEQIGCPAWLESLTTELHLEVQEQAEQARESARHHDAIVAKSRVLWSSVKDKAKEAVSRLRIYGKTDRERQVGFALVPGGFRLRVARFPSVDISLTMEEAGHFIVVSETVTRKSSGSAESHTSSIDIGLQGENITLELDGQSLAGQDAILGHAFRRVLFGAGG